MVAVCGAVWATVLFGDQGGIRGGREWGRECGRSSGPGEIEPELKVGGRLFP